jgi:hypothetical protein
MPDQGRRDRALAALLKPRRLPIIPSLTAIGALAVSLLVLVPRRESGLAWADVLRTTSQAQNLHITYLNNKGQVEGEQWRSGVMWSCWMKDDHGELALESRNDSHHFYTFVHRNPRSANAYQYGTVWNVTPQMLAGQKQFDGPIHTIDKMLGKGRYELISQEQAQVNGSQVQRYVVKAGGESSETVDADPKTGRFLFVHLKNEETLVFDYPQIASKKEFSFEDRRSRDVPVNDLRGHEYPKVAPPYMPRVIGSKKGIQLRRISISPEGDLFVYWTGYLPTSRAAKRLKILGIKSRRELGPTYDWDGVHPVPGPHANHLIFYRAALPEKIGKYVTIRIPTPTSYAEFTNVPVTRL